MEVRPRGVSRLTDLGDHLSLVDEGSLANPILAVVGVDGRVELAVTDDHHLTVASQTVSAVDHPPRLGGADQGTGLRGEVDALVEASLARIEESREAPPERPDEGKSPILDRVVTGLLPVLAAARGRGKQAVWSRAASGVGIHSRSPISSDRSSRIWFASRIALTETW